MSEQPDDEPRTIVINLTTPQAMLAGFALAFMMVGASGTVFFILHAIFG